MSTATSAVSQPPQPSPSILHPQAGRTSVPALRLEKLQKRYENIEAVVGLSFEIQQGEVFGLLGPNGAGKTSTISMVATRLRPTSGDAFVFGRSILRDIHAVRQMIGVVPQEIAIYPQLTAAENVRFFGRMYGVPKAELERRLDELLEQVGLDGRRNDVVATFSGGMKRRLNLAVSLVHHPQLVLLDEPTVGVDPHSRENIFSIVRGLRERGTAILYTTHYMEEAELLCDRIGIMDEGKSIAMGSLDELLTAAGCAEIVEVRGVSLGSDLTRWQRLPGVCRAEANDGVVRLYVTSASQVLAPLSQLMSLLPNEPSVQIAPMSLQTLFLHLTGKELRD